MSDIESLFLPLIGQPVWSPRRGVGTYLTMEIGNPFLSIREPLAKVSDTVPEKARRHLLSRRVTAGGQWHLWLLDCEWTVRTPNFELSSEGEFRDTEECLHELSGQRLTGVKHEKHNPGELGLEF